MHPIICLYSRERGRGRGKDEMEVMLQMMLFNLNVATMSHLVGRLPSSSPPAYDTVLSTADELSPSDTRCCTSQSLRRCWPTIRCPGYTEYV
jgi:hypothetical protein